MSGPGDMDGDRSGGAPALSVVRGSLDAAPVSRSADPGPDAPVDGRGQGAAPPPADGPQRVPGEIWPDCPVQALGVEGKVHWFLDALGQLQGETTLQKDRISALFGGRDDLLRRHFASYGRDGHTVTGWSQEKARSRLHLACHENRVWSASQRVRGAGAWTDPDGELVFHCGDRLLIGGRKTNPGKVDGYVYPTRPSQPRPAKDPNPDHVAELVAILATWRWTRGDIDARLLLGWIGCAIISGALEWRPMMWVSGDKSTGKSTLQSVIRGVIGGEGAMISTANTTAAGIYQQLGHDALPVAIDEFEPSADGRTDRSRGIIELARQAASGSVAYRGGADHTGTQFALRSCFLFSSILVPPLLDQDISRIALLELMPLQRGAPPPNPTPRTLGRIGASLRAIIIREWPRWNATLEGYRRALTGVGHAARGADQFGTLLAMADLLSEDDADASREDGWAAKITAESIQDTAEMLADWQRCAAWLMAQQPDAWRNGQRWTVAQLVRRVARLSEDGPEIEAAKQALDGVGIKVKGERSTARLAIATNHAQLARLFAETHWATGPGMTGVWAQSLRRAPDAQKGGALRFAGHQSKTWTLSVRTVLGVADDDAPDPTA
ncbi:MAG: hypothetical protein AAF192_12040 [Pseudomonadota bacterium]